MIVDPQRLCSGRRVSPPAVDQLIYDHGRQSGEELDVGDDRVNSSTHTEIMLIFTYRSYRHCHYDDTALQTVFNDLLHHTIGTILNYSNK